ncbi:MAG: hypothetical protein HY898_04425 [Deltaproteobacteria bacterium]|nr:hypothetical protein [Deltaproteobacteria bacterium]
MSNPRRIRQTLSFAGFAALGLVSWLQTSAMSRWLGDRLALNAKEIAGPIGEVARLGAPSRAAQPRTEHASIIAPPARVPEAPAEPQPAQAAQVDPYALAACADPARLALITAGQDASGSMAVMWTPTASGGRSYEMLREGSAHGAYRVWHIGRDRVWMIGKGESCQIRMFEPPPVPTHGDQPETKPQQRKGAMPPEIAAGIQKLGPTEYKVDRTVLDRVMQNPADLLKVRVVPEQEAGAVKGLRLFGIKPDTLLAAIGLQDGDRLDAVNGMGLGDAEAMMTALARLRMEKHLVVKVLRGGKEVNVDINVV